jgi:hypothetical protein
MLDETKCTNCQLCCCYYITILENQIILPSYKCKHAKDGGCDIYETRTCLRGEAIVEKKAIPKSCPYAPKGYKGREVASPELEKHIYNSLSEETKRMLAEGFEY